MGSIPGTGVRPTRAALDDIGQPVPDLGLALEDLPSELLVKAQRLPDQVAAGGADRIVSVDDRVWFKVKTGDWRGAATQYDVRNGDSPDDDVICSWWLCSAGHRKADSAQDDFYDQLKIECYAKRA